MFELIEDHGKKIAIASAVIGGILLWLYIGGALFLATQNQDPQQATLLTLYQYWYYYQNNPAVINWVYGAGGISLLPVLLPMAFFIKPQKPGQFGDAKFAKRADIKKAGLLGEVGLIVGKLGSKYLMFGGQQHAIISAPTRSGKGVGIVIPNLLNWSESLVVLDIKQENWDITSGFRKRHGQACYLFNPAAADYRTHRYNPLAYISDDANFRINDVQKIANMLFPDVDGVDMIWTATPRTLFLGLVLLLVETPGKPVTLGQVVRETLVEGDGAKYFARMVNERSEAGNPYSDACIRAINSYTSITADNTRTGVIASFRSRLEIWLNPFVDAATAANDFDLRELRKKRMSVYLGITPDNLERMAPLVNLFFQQAIDLNTRELPSQDKSLKYTCLLLMDEFTAIGEISVLNKGISYIAGYNLRMLPIIQSPSQLVDVYGEEGAKTFTTNHALNIVYPPKASDSQAAKDISEWLGNQTIRGVSVTKSKSILKRNSADQNLQISDQQRALLLPQEITSLAQGKELVIMENTPPILANKVVYFKDKVFIDRLKKVSKSLRALGRATPSRKQLEHAIQTGELAAPVPKIDLAAHQKSIQSDVPLTVSVPQQPGARPIPTFKRDITADDIANIDNLKLEDFNVDFSKIKKPAPGEMDEAVLKAYADELCRAMGMIV
jgi:type IV secretion system protein VirD4